MNAILTLAVSYYIAGKGKNQRPPLKDLVHNNAAKPTPKCTNFTAHSDKKYHAIEYSRQNIIYFDFSIDIQ